jgi:hypothetical protein
MKQTFFLFLIIFFLVIPCLAQEKELPKGKPITDLASGVLIGKATNLKKPPFPDCNCKFSKTSRVVVQFTVDNKGNIESAKAISGHPILKIASEIAARNSTFSVSRFAGEPVKSIGVITYEFAIKRYKRKVHILNYELKLESDK